MSKRDRHKILDSLRNKRSGLPVRKNAVLRKRLISRDRLCLSYLEARCLQSCPDAATVTRRVFALLTMHHGNRQFGDDVKVPFFTDHTVNFDSKTTEAENSFDRQL